VHRIIKALKFQKNKMDRPTNNKIKLSIKIKKGKMLKRKIEIKRK
jgi:hypothetical protein